MKIGVAQLGGRRPSVPRSCFVNLCNLRVLKLRHAPITELPDTLVTHASELRVIELDSCDLVELPGDLGSLANLQVIKIHSCKNLHKLPDSITQLSKLQSLDICYGALSGSLRTPRHPSTWWYGPDRERLDIPAGWRDDLVGWPHMLHITVWLNNQLHPHVYRPGLEYIRLAGKVVLLQVLCCVRFDTEPLTVPPS
jgi:hypothetical protein